MMETPNEEKIPVGYFGQLTVEGLKCFKGKETLELMDGKKPALFTVILGNNGTGKTTLLRALAEMAPEISKLPGKNNDEIKTISFQLDNNYVTKAQYRNIYPFRFLVKIWTNNNCHAELFFHKQRINSWQTGHFNKFDAEKLTLIPFYAYGTNRQLGQNEADDSWENRTITLFNPTKELIDAEKWLINLKAKNAVKSNEAFETKFQNLLLTLRFVLPEVEAIDLKSDTDDPLADDLFVQFKTPYGWVKLKDLSHGYQTMVAWIIDFARRMFQRYPKSDFPLKEPAVVLIDELDLHLHPNWQRKIVGFLRDQFPATQFIVTAHSPLVVQSGGDINVVVLEQQDDRVVIQNKGIRNFGGWTLDEILYDLMGLTQTRSDDYIRIRRQYDAAMDSDDYKGAKAAYDKLLTLMHPDSASRKFMAIEMAGLTEETAEND